MLQEKFADFPEETNLKSSCLTKKLTLILQELC